MERNIENKTNIVFFHCTIKQLTIMLFRDAKDFMTTMYETNACLIVSGVQTCAENARS